MSRRVLVCGSRDWIDETLLNRTLDELDEQERFDLVIEGEATGADTMARNWAERRRIPVSRFPAAWGLHGKAAGPIRNTQMLREGKPDLVVAFPLGPESRGTANMIGQAEKAGIPFLVVNPKGQRIWGNGAKP